MFPISDENAEPGLPVVTIGLIALCVAVFLWQITLSDAEAEHAARLYGMVPANVFGLAIGGQTAAIPAWATIFTSMFIHGGLAHIGGNMLYLWIFGDNVEHAMGRARFLLFYLLAGTIAALAQALQVPSSDVPMIGASGAISGVLGAYLLLHPFARIRVLIMPLPFFIRVVNIPAVAVLGFWFLIQFLSGLASPADQGGVAFWAHIGGFVAGVALVPFFKRRGVPLMQQERSRVFDARREDERSHDRQGGWRRGPWDR